MNVRFIPPPLGSLLVPKLLEDYPHLKHAFGTAESAVKLATYPAWLSRTLASQLLFAELASQAILFVVDTDEARAAMLSADESPAGVALPPVPFPNIVVEAAQDYSLISGVSSTGETMDVDAVAVSERIQGEEWACVLLMRPRDTQEETERVVQFIRVTRQGGVVLTHAPDGGLEEMAFEVGAIEGPNLRAAVIDLVHLLTARGVTPRQMTVPRPVRRRLERVTKLRYPTMYWVVIGSDDQSESDSPSDKTYSCRWLVRGHWRNYRTGDRTWVRPHIKGPEGAPWRGRPVYARPAT